MTPQSKAEAEGLAKALRDAKNVPVAWRGIMLEAARYIEANPAISGEQRKQAREFADKQRVKGYWDAAECRAICDLLDLIAGPEEVDPLAKFYANHGYFKPEEFAEKTRTALHQAGYEITPITKQEGV